jgi:nucleoside-diphosphate-sugar epimerase
MASTIRNVLITGGAGFIGANVAHRLLVAGKKVRDILFIDASSTPSRRRGPRSTSSRGVA